jgi:hypothetical protein
MSIQNKSNKAQYNYTSYIPPRLSYNPYKALSFLQKKPDRPCGLVVTVLGYRSGGPGSIPGTTKKKVVDLERGPLSLVSTTEELLDRKVAAPV